MQRLLPELAAALGRRLHRVHKGGAQTAGLQRMQPGDGGPAGGGHLVLELAGAQLERGGQWVKGKSFDTFAPIGPFFVPKEQKAIELIEGVAKLLNGEQKMQLAKAADLLKKG